MDGDNAKPSEADKPGAPALGSVDVPGAPLRDDPKPGPVFQPTPTSGAGESVPEATGSVSPELALGGDETQSQQLPSETPTEYQARIDKLRSQHDKPKRVGGRRIVKILLIILLVLILLAGGAYAYVKILHKPKAAAPTQSSTSGSSSQTQQPAQTTPTTTDNQNGTKTYTSTNFSLGLSYPEDWTPAETTQALTITSPVTTLTDASGDSAQGRIILTVRHKTAKPDEFKSGGAVAVLASEKVNYTSPTSTQRKSTYLSFLQYATTTVKGGLDGIYITGDLGYKYAQDIPQADIAQVDPLVDVTFVRCAASDQTTCATAGQTPLTISSDMWKSDTFKTPISDMLTSLTLN